MKLLPFVTAIACFGLLLMGMAQADIVIGQSSPLTGVASETGKNLALGAKACFEQINAKGGINGHLIKHVVLDDKSNPAETVSNARRLIDKEKALALVNFHGTSNVAELIKSQQLDNAGIPLVGVYTGARAAREPFTPYIFHTRAGYREEVEKIVAILGNLGMTSIGVLYEDDAFGQAGLNAVMASIAKKPGMKLMGKGSYAQQTDEVDAAAKALAKENPQAVIMVAITQPAAAFIAKFRQLGGTSQLFNISAANFEELVRINGVAAVHGVAISQVFPFPYQSTLTVVRDYQAAMKRYAAGNKLSYASLEGYINARILSEAIRRAGNSPSRDGVLKALEHLNDFDLGGYYVNFTEMDRLGSHFVQLTMLNQSGELSY